MNEGATNAKLGISPNAYCGDHTLFVNRNIATRTNPNVHAWTSRSRRSLRRHPALPIANTTSEATLMALVDRHRPFSHATRQSESYSAGRSEWYRTKWSQPSGAARANGR